ncbi:MAG: transglycosylase SLT domain-containing protein [Anaerolineae bacterium]|nr:transglycosylase SLT domain-containing protein [Anaerolineae bacterium]
MVNQLRKLAREFLKRTLICLIGVMMFAPQLVLASCPSPVDGLQYWPYGIALDFDRASRNQLEHLGPTYPQIHTGYPDPTFSQSYVVPAIILKAIAQVESQGWYQFEASYGEEGPTVINYNNGTCDIGLMQVNSATMDEYGLDNDRAASSHVYNIGAGAYILIKKWNDISSYYSHYIGGNNPAIAEDWYYAVWRYHYWGWRHNPNNEWPQGRFNPDREPYDGTQPPDEYPYQELVWGWAANPPGTSFWEAVPLTLPPKQSITNPPPTWIPRPVPNHPDPHASTHLPNIRVNRDDYDDRSVISARNVSGDYAAVNVTIYDQDGDQVGSSDHTLASDASWTVNAFDIAGGGIQYLSGSAVVAASPEVAVVVQNRTSSMITAYDGIGPGTATAPDPGFGKVANTLRLPVIMRNHDYYQDGDEWNTTIYIQNAGTATANVYVYFYNENGSSKDSDAYTIEPGASINLDQASDWELGSSFIGTAKVVSPNQPVAAIVNEVNDSNDRAMAYNAFSFGAKDVYLPLSFRNCWGLDSDIPVQNIGSGRNVTVTYYEQGTTWSHEDDPEYIGYRALHIFDPPPEMDGRLAAAVVRNSSSNLIALLDERKDSIHYMTYNGVPKTASMATSYESHVPILYRESSGKSGWQSSIQVQNIESELLNFITADFFDQDGDEILFLADWVASNRSMTFYLPPVVNLPNNYVGSAVVEGHDQVSYPGDNVNRKLIAIANVQDFLEHRGGGYNGFNR